MKSNKEKIIKTVGCGARTFVWYIRTRYSAPVCHIHESESFASAPATRVLYGTFLHSQALLVP